MENIKNIIKLESKLRIEAITKLHSYITNPGRFSILLLGARGTGKAYWLKKLQEIHEKDKSKILSQTVFINSLLANNYNKKEWEAVFKKSNNSLLVFTDIEDLSKENQAILFEGISTGQGGKLGFESKQYDIRIAFTSSKDISILRDNEFYLSHKFFDRICQFAVQLPSYESGSSIIWKDFKKTWYKMNFQQHNETPGIELKEWLESNSLILFGNFRDLDKIAIIWHNYRLLNVKEESILNKVKTDFIDFCKYPEHNTDVSKQLEIIEDFTWLENLNQFRMKYTKYLIGKYGTLKQGANESGLSYRTLEGWANGKGTRKKA